jgi:hypothetical protein
MSKIYVDEIAGIASADTVAIPGHVIQVVQTVEKGTPSESLTAGNFGSALLATNITPSSTSSKILVDVTIHVNRNTSPQFAFGCFGIFRGGSIIDSATGNTDASRPRVTAGLHLNGTSGDADIANSSIKFLDSPSSTSELTYDIRLYATGTATYQLNRTRGDNNNDGGVRTISVLTLMEIAG